MARIMIIAKNTGRANWLYILPNSITTLSLLLGFYSMIMAITGNFVIAAYAIFIAFFADGFDGRIARLTKTQSKFGEIYDSLSDMIAFGIAPASMIYCSMRPNFHILAWIFAAIYLTCTALRLARFTIVSQSEDKRYFKGLPCPMAAGTVASLIWFYNQFAISNFASAVLFILLTGLVSFLMISSIRYHSMKGFDTKTRYALFALLLVCISWISFVYQYSAVLFAAFFCYLISGKLKVNSSLP